MTPKSAREALCLAEARLTESTQDRSAARTLGDMIRFIDLLRPIGVDGKHGNKHTPFCGCDP